VTDYYTNHHHNRAFNIRRKVQRWLDLYHFNTSAMKNRSSQIIKAKGLINRENLSIQRQVVFSMKCNTKFVHKEPFPSVRGNDDRKTTRVVYKMGKLHS
jgi:hypothetical protein